MSFRITFPLDDLTDRDLAKAQISVLLTALANVSAQEIARAGKGFPTLAAAPVVPTDTRSRLRPANQEEWKDTRTALLTGMVEPFSAVAWRVAELNARGVRAAPEIVDAGRNVRAVVRWPDGRIEDVAPSAGISLARRMRISFLLDLFKSKAQEAESHEALKVLLQAVTINDVLYLQTHPNTPKLYDSGVFYREEPGGCEDWQDIPTSLRRGRCDCDDVACWRAAELIVQGVPASADFEIQRSRDGKVLYHIITRTAHGTEDPSYILGMR